MKNKKTCIAKEIDLSNYRELSEAELFLVNGGKKVDNSNAAVAEASVGDTLKRNDGTEVTLNQGDIDYAKAQIGRNSGGTGAGDMEAAPNSPSPSAPSSYPSAYGAQSQPGNGSGAPTGMPSYSAWGSDGSTQEMTASGAGNPPGQNSSSIAYQPQGSQGNGAGSANNPGYSYNGGYGNLPDSLNPNSPSFSAADMGYYQSMNSMAMMKKNKESPVITNTAEALKLYYDNDGSPAWISGKAFDAVKAENNKIYNRKIKSGKTTLAEGNYTLDMTLQEFFIGKTRIDYKIDTSEKTSTVTFTAFNYDGFWDADVFAPKETEDGPGPNNELEGGTVYPFIPRSWSMTFDNPKKMNWLSEH